MSPQPAPKEVTPTSWKPHSSGPPESPCSKYICTVDLFFSLTGVKTSKWCWAQWLRAHIHSSYLLDRYPLLFCHLNQHIPCHWWLKVRSCNIHKSYTYVCQSQSRGQTWEHPRCGSLQLFPIQQPDTWCHLQGLWQFCPTGAILQTWLHILVP